MKKEEGSRIVIGSLPDTMVHRQPITRADMKARAIFMTFAGRVLHVKD